MLGCLHGLIVYLTLVQIGQKLIHLHPVWQNIWLSMVYPASRSLSGFNVLTPDMFPLIVSLLCPIKYMTIFFYNRTPGSSASNTTTLDPLFQIRLTFRYESINQYFTLKYMCQSFTSWYHTYTHQVVRNRVWLISTTAFPDRAITFILETATHVDLMTVCQSVLSPSGLSNGCLTYCLFSDMLVLHWSLQSSLLQCEDALWTKTAWHTRFSWDCSLRCTIASQQIYKSNAYILGHKSILDALTVAKSKCYRDC